MFSPPPSFVWAQVATPEDPSSARLGEGLWSFIPRSVLGNLRDGYGAEAARRARRGIPALSPRNR
jgi:alkane 1-monooxygenase